jgi:hypothetical protein
VALREGRDDAPPRVRFVAEAVHEEQGGRVAGARIVAEQPFA